MPKDDDVEIPSMMLDQDEVNERRASQDTVKKRPSSSTDTTNTDTSYSIKVEDITTVAKPSLVGVYTLLGVILCVFSVVVFMMWSQNQQLKSELQIQIKDLDNQLIAADASASEQGLTIEETLNKHNSEIRKLWGVSYDTNRKSIKGNNQSIETLKKEIATFDKTLSQQNKSTLALEATQKKLNATVNKIATVELVTLKDQQSSIKKSLLGIEDDASMLVSKSETQSLQITQLLKSLADLESSKMEGAARVKKAETALREITDKISTIERKLTTQLGDARPGDLQIQLADHQEAIDSIDVYRIQVNSKLNRLESNVNQLLLEAQVE